MNIQTTTTLADPKVHPVPAGRPTTIVSTLSNTDTTDNTTTNTKPPPDHQTTSALSAFNLALSTFTSLSAKCKPRPNHEWTTLAAIVLSIPVASTPGLPGTVSATLTTPSPPREERQLCVSLATGTKCLPATALEGGRGKFLHDCHAEVLALRGFSRWLLQEVRRILDLGFREGESDVLQLTTANCVNTDMSGEREMRKPWRLKDDVKVHLVSTAAPCGAASLELLMRTKNGDDEPWEVIPAPIVPAVVSDTTPSEQNEQHQHPTHGQSTLPSIQRGHGGFHPSLLSAVRTKPARRDAPPTLSKSCSDKLSLAQVQGVLRFPADLFVEPVFLDNLIVPESAFHAEGYERAFERTGRMKPCGDVDDNGGEGRAGVSTRSTLQQTHRFSSVVLRDVDAPFEFSKDTERGRKKVSNASAIYINQSRSTGFAAPSDIIESLINGVKQGFRQDSSHHGKESVVSRRQMWLLGKEVSDMIGAVEKGTSRMGISGAREIQQAMVSGTYREAKGCASRAPRKDAKKEAMSRLGGWIANARDDDWKIDE